MVSAAPGGAVPRRPHHRTPRLPAGAAQQPCCDPAREHLVKQNGRFWLVFRANETKTRQRYEAIFPESLVAALDRYLNHHRPVLLNGERRHEPAELDALWVSEVATALEAGALATRIRKQTRRAFGLSLPPHWFRDAAATSIAIEDPKHVRDARHVLGHTNLATTERHYNQARSLEASRRHHAVLATLRTSLKSNARDVGDLVKSAREDLTNTWKDLP